jgi:hypothetical protein
MNSGRSRHIAALAVLTCSTLLMPRPVALHADDPSPEVTLERFLASRTRRAPSYRAFRRLEATSTKLHASGWVEAVTEFDAEAGLRVRILAEEGSGRIRGVLKGVLDGERQATLPGKSRAAALTMENYEFEASPANADGLVAVRVKPRRRESALVDGTIFVTANDGDLVRVEGRLAKSPSFWTRSVDVVRRYERRAGTPMLVEVRSHADVKFAGPSEFVMRYAYESVNGQAANDVPPTILARLTDAPRIPR